MDRSTSVTIVVVIVAVLLSGALGFYFANITVAQAPPPVTQTTTKTTTVVSTVSQTAASSSSQKPTGQTVSLNVVPDWGGGGYDAFINPANMNGSIPQRATNTSAPGVNNNITVTAGVPVTFIITDLDDMEFNFSSVVSVPYTVYNNTDDGQTAVHYSAGQSAHMVVSHTFTINELNLNIPIPPSEVVSFTYTFTKPGTYMYLCMTPCGPGMTTIGYMYGYVIVK